MHFAFNLAEYTFYQIHAYPFPYHILEQVDSEGQLRTKRYDKRDDFNFPIVNFPFICSNIPAAPAYGVYISVDTTFQSLLFLPRFP